MYLASPGENPGDIKISLSDGGPSVLAVVYISAQAGLTDQLSDVNLNDLADAIAALELPLALSMTTVDTVVSIERVDQALTPITVT